MPNILAVLIIAIAYIPWGLWLCDRRWKSVDDLDKGFFISIIPVAILTWFALYLVGAQMALTDAEYADITLFLGYPSLQNWKGVKNKIDTAIALEPTLATYRENQIRDLIKQLKQYQKDLRAGEQNFGMVRQPGTVINSGERQAMLIASARNAVTDLSVLCDAAIVGDVFSRGRGMGSAKVSRG